MISVEEALDKILSYVNVLEAESCPILASLGQVLAEDVRSEIDVPPLDNSAMDGYAVRSTDTIGTGKDSPRILRVIDTVAAGSISRLEVKPGATIRIMTGAPLPKGADAVVPFEDTDEVARRTSPNGRSNEIGILQEVKEGANIRSAGEDVRKGALVLSKGTVIRPSEAGVLASLGRSSVPVIRRPVVAVLATGDELVELGKPLPHGKIYNSNSYSAAAMVIRYGGIPKLLGIALDSESSLTELLEKGLDTDLFITTGGVSKGDYDMVKDILAKMGEISFWTVRMKPGKPLAFGLLKGRGKDGVRAIPHLGLPGNPVSVMITFELFARPAILKMMGLKNFAKPTIEAVLEDSLSNSDGRRIFARVSVEKREGRYFARLTGPQGSGILTSMSRANGLAIIPESKARVEKGERVRVMMLDWDEEKE